MENFTIASFFHVQGQFFSGNSHRIYLLGNPIIWWGNIGFLIVFALVYVHASIREQRADRHEDPALVRQRKKLKDAGFWLFVGWILHYAPFWAMGRVLYFHHYFPALLYSSMLTGVALNFIIEAIYFVLPSRLANTVNHVIMALVISATVYRYNAIIGCNYETEFLLFYYFVYFQLLSLCTARLWNGRTISCRS